MPKFQTLIDQLDMDRKMYEWLNYRPPLMVRLGWDLTWVARVLFPNRDSTQYTLPNTRAPDLAPIVPTQSNPRMSPQRGSPQSLQENMTNELAESTKPVGIE